MYHLALESLQNLQNTEIVGNFSPDDGLLFKTGYVDFRRAGFPVP